MREQDKKMGPDDGVMMVSRMSAPGEINKTHGRGYAGSYWWAKRQAKKGVVVAPVEVIEVESVITPLTLDNETKAGSYWAKQTAVKSKPDLPGVPAEYRKHDPLRHGWGRHYIGQVGFYRARAVEGAGISPKQ